MPDTRLTWIRLVLYSFVDVVITLFFQLTEICRHLIQNGFPKSWVMRKLSGVLKWQWIQGSIDNIM